MMEEKYAFDEFQLGTSSRCRVSMDTHKTQCNNNILVVGGSGSGKTRSILNVFCQADFPIFVVGIPHRHRGKIPTFSGPCQEAGSTTASCRMRACSIR